MALWRDARLGADMRLLIRRLKSLKRPKVGRKLPGRRPLVSSAVGRRLGAMGCIATIVVAWIAMAEFVQGMETKFPKPYFLRIVVNAAYIMCLVLWSVWRFFPRKGVMQRQGVDVDSEVCRREEPLPPRPAVDRFEARTLYADPESSSNLVGNPTPHDEVKVAKFNDVLDTSSTSSPRYNYLGYFNWCYFFGASIVLALVSFVSGWLWFISLPLTSVSGNSAIYQSMCTMVYVFSIIFLKERVTILKTLAVIVSVVGVLFVSFSGDGKHIEPTTPIEDPTAILASSAAGAALRVLQATVSDIVANVTDALSVASTASPSTSSGWLSAPAAKFPSKANSVNALASGHAIDHEQSSSAVGYFVCFASMILYSLYEVLYKKWASHSADPVPLMNAMRFLGLVGVSSLIFCAPFLLVVDILGVEPFECPTSEEWKMLAIVAVLDTTFNLFLLFAIMLSSPLFASIGCLLVLPVSVVWDYFAHGYELPPGAFIGVGCIVSGFVAFVFEEYKTTLSPTAKESPLYAYEMVGETVKRVDRQRFTDEHAGSLPHPMGAAGSELDLRSAAVGVDVELQFKSSSGATSASTSLDEQFPVA